MRPLALPATPARASASPRSPPLLHGVIDGRTVLAAVMTERCGADSHGPDHDEFLVVCWDVETAAEVARSELMLNERRWP